MNCLIMLLTFALSKTAHAEGFFQLKPVDYFKHIEQKTEPQPQVFDWSEPMLSPDGKVSLYQPPGPVLNLLNMPSEDNAKAYIQWQEEKTARILKAQVAVESFLKAQVK